jgi:hypothetical protein
VALVLLGDGTIGATEDITAIVDMVTDGIVGTDGTTGAGEDIMAMADTTVIVDMEDITARLGALLTDTTASTTPIEITPTTQEDEGITIETPSPPIVRDRRPLEEDRT